jgi:hypothetical protein
MIQLFLSHHQGTMQENNVHIFKVRLFTLEFSSSNLSCDKITNKILKMLYCWVLLCVVVCTRCAGGASYSTDYWTAVTSSAIIHIRRKYQVFRVVCSERVHYANATCHLPRNLAHAYIAFWTGIISWSVDSTYALVAKGKAKGRLGNASRRGNINIKIRVNEHRKDMGRIHAAGQRDQWVTCKHANKGEIWGFHSGQPAVTQCTHHQTEQY